MADVSDWRDTFCGRIQELAQLVSRFQEVQAGKGPRLTVILGERGMGKTRLAQELYRVLAAQYDPQNYWPDDTSLFVGKNLCVAPHLADPAVQNHYRSFKLEERPMPFLWWGFRLSDPIVRNAARNDMATHRATLDPHLGPVFYARRAAAARERLKGAGIDAGTELGKTLLIEAVKSIPGLGIAATALELFLQYAEKGKRAADAVRQEHQLQEQQRNLDLIRAESDRADDILTHTLADLTELLAPGPELTPLPIVVFCDDAQFACEGGDEGALRLLSDLWLRAYLNGWPLLLVLTHWAVEWTHDARQKQRRTCASTFRKDARSARGGLLIDLPKEPALAELLRSGLPGLPPADVALLLGKADGNPQVLIELVELVRRSPAWRCKGDGGLTPHARAEIELRATSLVALILERLESDSTPETVRQAVALSSVQGMEFLCQLTTATAQALDLSGAADGIQGAQYPHRLVVGVDGGVAGFAQRAYREAAFALLGGHVGNPSDIEQVLLTTAISFVDTPDRWRELSAQEQTTVWCVLVGLAEDHPEQAIRHYAGRALLELVHQALTARPGCDFARAAELAVRFEEGLAKRWNIESFPMANLDEVRKALSAWFGPTKTITLTRAILQRSRELVTETGTTEARIDLSIALGVAGQLAQLQGEWSQADELYREALAIRRELADQLNIPQARSHVPVMLHLIGELAQVQGEWAQADELFREALTISRELAVQLGTPEARHDLVDSLECVGSLAQERGDWAQSEELYREALAISRELASLLGTPEAWRDLSASLERFGVVAQKQCDWAQSDERYRECLAINRELAEHLGTFEARRDLSIALEKVGVVAREQSDLEQADYLFRESLMINRELAAKLGTPKARRDLSIALEKVGVVAQEQSDLAQAQELYLEALAIRRDLAAQMDTPEAWRDLSIALGNVDMIARLQGNRAQSDELYCEALAIRRALAKQLDTPEAWRDLEITLERIDVLERLKSDKPQADEQYREAMAIRCELAEKRAMQLDTPEAWCDLSVALEDIGKVARLRGDWVKADKQYRKALAIRRELAAQMGTAEAQRELSIALENAGAVAVAVARLQGDWSQADELMREVLAVRRELATQLGTVEARRDLSVLLNKVGLVAAVVQGDWTQAGEHYRESLAINREVAAQLGTPEAQRDLSTALQHVGQAAWAQGDWVHAGELYQESLTINRELAAHLGTPEAQRYVGVTLALLASVANTAGDAGKSCGLLREALLLFEALTKVLKTQESKDEVEMIREQMAQYGCGLESSGQPSAS